MTLGLENVHWLDDESRVAAGVRFVGATLWSGEHRTELERDISDSKVIAGIRNWVLEKNAHSPDFLRRRAIPETRFAAKAGYSK